MKIALIAHDKKKEEMIVFCKRHVDVLKRHQLFATGTTGTRIMDATGLIIHCFRSGPLGGDQEIGAKVSYTAPNGREISVEIVAAEFYA